jgi:hypothetical protein
MPGFRPSRRHLVVAACLVSFAACGGSDDSSPPVLRVDLIAPALEAVREAGADDLGFFEVNATPSLVNLFVAADLDGTPNADGRPDAVVQYVYLADGGLQEPVDPVGASGPVFIADEVGFDPDAVLETVLGELPESTPAMFVITSAGSLEVESDRVEYRVRMMSDLGGELSVVVTGDGEIVGTDAM